MQVRMHQRRSLSRSHLLESLRATGAWIATVAIVALLLSGSNISNGQTIDPAQTIIDKLAEYALPSDDSISRVVRSLGYSPSTPENVWRSFPALRKLDSAYRAAEGAQSGNGRRFLAEAVRRLSSEVESIRNDPELKRYVTETPAGRTSLTFNETAGRTLTAIDGQAYQIITRISDYAERGVLGGASTVLTRELGLSEMEAYEILRLSSSTREALVSAYWGAARIVETPG
jgi:hypothetical protein